MQPNLPSGRDTLRRRARWLAFAATLTLLMLLMSGCVIGLGRSVQGRKLNVLALGGGPVKVLFIGGLHTGPEDNTRVLAELMTRHFILYPHEIPDNMTLLFVRSANPDGTENGTHENAHGVDLNRNWPSFNWRSDPYHPSYGRRQGAGGSHPLSEPETRAIWDFIMDERPAMIFVWHAAASLVEANETGFADQVSRLYAQRAGYEYINEWTYYELNGQFIDAVQEEGFPAADIELSATNETDFTRNLNAIRAVLPLISANAD